MPLPRLTVTSARGALRRPVVLVPTTALALAGLLGGGLLVANAVDAPPTSPTAAESTAETSPSPTPDPDAAAPAVASEAPADPAATTTSGGDDNVAVAVNTRDGSTVYALRLKVVITGADVVDAGNAAVAAASCSDCQTVAIALEGVLVTGDAEVIAPENVALAINSGCSGCSTLAYAYQDLQTVDGRVRLTGAGRRGIASLRQQLSRLRTSGLDIGAVEQEVDRIARAFAALLDSEVVPIGRQAAPASPAAQDAASSPATAATSPTPAAPTETPAAGPAADDTPAEASPEPTASADPASPEPSPATAPSGG